MFYYLDEEITENSIGKYYWKWSKQYENLAQWTIEEWHYPLDGEEIGQENKNLVSSTSANLGQRLVFHFANTLTEMSVKSHAKKPLFGKSLWLYYYYCQFLWQVLQEFDQIMQELGVSSIYYQRYQTSLDLFHDMATVMEQERPFLDKPDNVDEATMQAIWEEIDITAARLGAEWRQAVLEAAHNQQLPDFISPK